jgi:hypothetical protein
VRPRYAIILVAVISVIFIAITLGLYVKKFGSPYLSDDRGHWGVFGDYVGGVLNPVLATANLAVVIYIAFALGQIQREHETKRLLFEHLRAWNSEEMYRNRDTAVSLIRKYPYYKLQQFDDPSIVGRTSLWTVLAFFSDQYFSVQHDILTAEDSVSLFGSIYTWWNVIAVQDDYPKEWSFYEGWKGFGELVSQHAKAEDLKKWRKGAETDLERYRSNHTSSPSPNSQPEQAVSREGEA